MPLLNTKIEGKGNGIKTVVPNMADIARALARPPACALSPYPCLLFYTDLWVKLTSFLVSLFFAQTLPSSSESSLELRSSSTTRPSDTSSLELTMPTD
jgi:hypothetical protein